MAEVKEHQIQPTNGIISKLVKLRAEGNFDPTNPKHAAIISEAMEHLDFCGDTMALLLEATGEREKKKHTKTWDAFFRRDEE